jgi:hypothetical protein
VALVTVLTVAAPAWASAVQIQDAASKPTFNADVRNKITATFPVVIGINTQARHESIQVGPRAGLSQSAAVSAASTANKAFVGTMRTSNDYNAAVTSALDSLRTSLAVTDRGLARSAPAQSSGWGLFPFCSSSV